MTEQRQSRVILVTGASSGIGLACSQLLLDEGYRVVGMARDFSNTGIDNPRFQPLQIDFSSLDSLPAMLSDYDNNLSEVDSIILCAGVGRFGSLEEFSFDQIRKLMDTNFTSQAYVLRHVLPQLKKHGHGDIIILGSEAALAGGRRGAIYSASKFALRGLAQSLRDECGKSGLRITIINPGMVRTDFFKDLNFTHGDEPENYIEAQDVAAAALHVLQARRGTVFDEITLSPLNKVVRFKKQDKF